MTPPPSKHLVSLMIIFSIQQQQVQGRFDGDKYKYDNQIIQQQPEIIGEPIVLCTSRFMIITVYTPRPLIGRIYIEDREFDGRCSSELSLLNGHNSTIRIPLLPCLIIDESRQNTENLVVWGYLRINFHQVFVTGQSRLFHVQCPSLTKAQILDDVQQPGTVNTICHHHVKSPTFPYRVGKVFFHEWSCSEEYDNQRYLMLCRECSVISKTKSSILLIDEFGCIVDSNLISNLHNGADNGPQKFTALSQIFKFPGESDIRFRCKILLVPRSTIEASVIKIPRCAGLNLNYSQDAGESFPKQNSINFPDQIETSTLTDWIKIHESEEDEALFESTESIETVSSLDDLYRERENRRSSRRYSNRASRKKILFSTEIADLQPINIEKYEKDLDSNNTKQTWSSTNGHVDVSEWWIKVENKTNKWIRINDLILNQTDESLKIFAHPSATNSRFNLTLPLQNTDCPAWMVNIVLLVWSILSTVAWLIFLAYKTYQFFLRDYVPSFGDVDERFVHDNRNTGVQLYMPWLDSSPVPDYKAKHNAPSSSDYNDRRIKQIY